MELNVLCWEALPLFVGRWSWTSRGLCSSEDMAVFHGTTDEEIWSDEAKMETLHTKLSMCERVMAAECHARHTPTRRKRTTLMHIQQGYRRQSWQAVSAVAFLKRPCPPGVAVYVAAETCRCRVFVAWAAHDGKRSKQYSGHGCFVKCRAWLTRPRMAYPRLAYEHVGSLMASYIPTRGIRREGASKRRIRL